MRFLFLLCPLVAGCFDYEHLSSGLIASGDGWVIRSDGGEESGDGAVTEQADGMPVSFPDMLQSCDGGPFTKHSNGVGQYFYDCDPPSTYDEDHAKAACAVYDGPPGTTCKQYLCADGAAVCGGVSYNQVVIWYYAGSRTGQIWISNTVCNCTVYPPSGTWN